MEPESSWADGDNSGTRPDHRRPALDATVWQYIWRELWRILFSLCTVNQHQMSIQLFHVSMFVYTRVVQLWQFRRLNAVTTLLSPSRVPVPNTARLNGITSPIGIRLFATNLSAPVHLSAFCGVTASRVIRQNERTKSHQNGNHFVIRTYLSFSREGWVRDGVKVRLMVSVKISHANSFCSYFDAIEFRTDGPKSVD